jgi:dTDP-4-dehydrorhamnose reductase
MQNFNNILIVGIDSQIGSALNNYLGNLNFNIFGTTRRDVNSNPKLFYFDLESPNFDVFDENFDITIICCGTTSIYECNFDRIMHRSINVINTIKLIDYLYLVNNKNYIIFLSSNCVFSGEKQFYSYKDKTCPLTMYGVYKDEVERYILNNTKINSSILRLTKVLSKNTLFLSNWYKAGLSGEKIVAFNDQFLSPVTIDQVLEAIYLLIIKKQKGIYQLGGLNELSYFDFAKMHFQDNQKFLNLICSFSSLKLDDPPTYNSMETYLP